MDKYEKENYNDLKVDLTNEILGDPMFILGDCDRIISDYKAHCPDIFDKYQKFEEEYRIDNEDEWDKEYFILLVLWFQSNFSLARLPYIKKVGEKVYASERSEYEEELKRRQDKEKVNKQETNNTSMKEGVPSKHYKVNEVVDLNKLQSVINRSLKALDIIEKKVEEGNKTDEINDDLKSIRDIESEAKKLMKNSLGFKQKTTTESIQFLYDQREKNIENYLNESFEMCDKLFKVLDKCNDMTLNESIGEKAKSIAKVVKKGALALIKKLRDIGLQILAFIKKLIGVNRIQAEGDYIDINKALDIINKIISKYS